MSAEYVIASEQSLYGHTLVILEVEGDKFRLHITETDERFGMEGRYIYPGTPEDFT